LDLDQYGQIGAAHDERCEPSTCTVALYDHCGGHGVIRELYNLMAPYSTSVVDYMLWDMWVIGGHMNEVILLENLDSACMDRVIDSQNSGLECIAGAKILRIREWYLHVFC